MAAPQLGDFFKRWARGRGVKIADQMAIELNQILSVQAPTRVTKSGRIVAATKATPFAPPRRVRGQLQSSVQVWRTVFGAKLRIQAFYGYYLEKSHRWYGWPHEFMKLAYARLGITGRHS